jgi:hypothetical protein
LLHPVAHRTTLRVAILAGREDPGIDARRLPPAVDVARAWRAQLERGLRVVLPDSKLAEAVDTARAETLLAATGPSPTGLAVAALEDWGLDAEAADGWQRLRTRERRRASQRPAAPSSWTDVRGAVDIGGAELLLRLRSLLVHEQEAEVTFLADLPEEWRGASIDVRDAPTRAGRVSYAVRWHGEHPALLWEGPLGVTFRAPGLDREWHTDLERGEALLGAAVP